MRKKFFKTALLIFLCLFLTGCFKGEMKINIRPDGSADVEYTAVAASMIANIIEEQMTSFKEDNYEITQFKEGDNIGFKATKQVKDVSEMNKHKLFEGKDGKPGITIDKGFFSDSYKINVSNTLNDTGKPLSAQDRSLFSQVTMTIIITFPAKPTSHNADKVSNDGKTLEWVLSFADDEYSLTAEATRLNTMNIAAVILLPLAAILFFLARKKKSLEQTTSK
jgi:hypothetical protein